MKFHTRKEKVQSQLLNKDSSPNALDLNKEQKTNAEGGPIGGIMSSAIGGLMSGTMGGTIKLTQHQVEVLNITKNISKALQLDLDKHHTHYPEIQVKTFAQSHDRFLLIDQADLYHIGGSLKDLGKKPVVSEVESWFAFSRMDSMTALLLNQLKNVK